MLDLVSEPSAILGRLLASVGGAASLDHIVEVVQVLKCFVAFWPYLVNMSGRWTKGCYCYKTHT